MTRFLTSVPSVPHSVTHWTLSRNHLGSLRNKAFINATDLLFLDLSYCGLKHVHKDVFFGLTKLQVLDISSSTFGTVPAGLFLPLPSLKLLGALGVYFSTFEQISHLHHLEKLQVQFPCNYQGQVSPSQKSQRTALFHRYHLFE